MNLVLVILVRSSSNPQNLVTFASSKGASTSSKTQMGDGFTKKTANTNDKQLELVLHQKVMLLTEAFTRW